jgi:hypothetical protein
LLESLQVADRADFLSDDQTGTGDLVECAGLKVNKMTLFSRRFYGNETEFYKTDFSVQENIPFVARIELFLSTVTWPLLFS